MTRADVLEVFRELLPLLEEELSGFSVAPMHKAPTEYRW